MAGPLFLMWYDDNPKIASVKKIEAAISVYAERFHLQPNLVLLNEGEQLDYPGVVVRGVNTISRNNYWVGYERAEGEADPWSPEVMERMATRGTKAVKQRAAPPAKAPQPVVPQPIVSQPVVSQPAAPQLATPQPEAPKARRATTARKRATAA